MTSLTAGQSDINRELISLLPCCSGPVTRILTSNKTRQGYVCKRILKPAGYFFVRSATSILKLFGGTQ
jgi:hypothetical protein